jgi:hypothetical protein
VAGQLTALPRKHIQRQTQKQTESSYTRTETILIKLTFKQKQRKRVGHIQMYAKLLWSVDPYSGSIERNVTI